MNKPKGQCEVSWDDGPGFMWKLPVRKLERGGQVTERKLQQMGIASCADLQGCSGAQLSGGFG